MLNELRAKPEGIRRQIVLWTTIIVTLLIFFFWLSTLTPKAPAPAATIVAPAAIQAETSPGPAAVFLGFISAGLERVINSGAVLYQKVK